MSRILIVEDEPALAMALDDDLQREGSRTICRSRATTSR